MSRCPLFIPLTILFATLLSITPVSASTDDNIIVYKINISGNDKTNEKIIHRELTFNLNDTLLASEIDYHAQRSKENLNNTRLFNFITITYHILNGRIEWTIAVEER